MTPDGVTSGRRWAKNCLRTVCDTGGSWVRIVACESTRRSRAVFSSSERRPPLTLQQRERLKLDLMSGCAWTDNDVTAVRQSRPLIIEPARSY
jgi:hypothetical protein